jgi:hypothetical protein
MMVGKEGAACCSLEVVNRFPPSAAAVLLRVLLKKKRNYSRILVEILAGSSWFTPSDHTTAVLAATSNRRVEVV